MPARNTPHTQRTTDQYNTRPPLNPPDTPLGMLNFASQSGRVALEPELKLDLLAKMSDVEFKSFRRALVDLVTEGKDHSYMRQAPAPNPHSNVEPTPTPTPAPAPQYQPYVTLTPTPTPNPTLTFVFVREGKEEAAVTLKCEQSKGHVWAFGLFETSYKVRWCGPLFGVWALG